MDVDVPDPDSLNDEALHAALWTTIEALGRMRVCLDETEHLSDRELYTLLWGELLPEEMPALAPDDDSAWHIDILGGCSEEDIALRLKHYADQKTRPLWRADFPRLRSARSRGSPVRPRSPSAAVRGPDDFVKRDRGNLCIQASSIGSARSGGARAQGEEKLVQFSRGGFRYCINDSTCIFPVATFIVATPQICLVLTQSYF